MITTTEAPAAAATTTAAITMPGLSTSVTCVRRWATRVLAHHPCAENAVLALSEAATNAVQHTASGEPGGRYSVDLHIGPASVELAVTDAGRKKLPPAETPMFDEFDEFDAAEHGRGLLIIDRLAAEWGLEQWDADDGDRCCVWARIEDQGAD